MLRDAKGAWSVTCDRCRAKMAACATPELAGAAATAAGWLGQPRKGKGLEKHPWLCTTCRPGDASGHMGRSVGAGK